MPRALSRSTTSVVGGEICSLENLLLMFDVDNIIVFKSLEAVWSVGRQMRINQNKTIENQEREKEKE
eukprot:m.90031 g.90031  ORF g.90031 m.90031 type:complete len:67 (-) comp26358_c0_seq1:492-692(-)